MCTENAPNIFSPWVSKKFTWGNWPFSCLFGLEYSPCDLNNQPIQSSTLRSGVISTDYILSVRCLSSSLKCTCKCKRSSRCFQGHGTGKDPWIYSVLRILLGLCYQAAGQLITKVSMVSCSFLSLPWTSSPEPWLEPVNTNLKSPTPGPITPIHPITGAQRPLHSRICHIQANLMLIDLASSCQYCYTIGMHHVGSDRGQRQACH